MRAAGRVMLLEFSLTVFLMTVLAFQAAAREYIIGTDDKIQISFWQQPDLNTTVRVRHDGKISLPLLGEVEAAGLTPKELEEKVVKGISVYNKRISQARVEVLEYNSRAVFVTGEVNRPGKFAFEFIPNLWEVLREAGGPTGRASLTEVSVIRGGEEAGRKISVNLAQVLEKGDFSELPELRPGDTVIVPAFPVEGTPAPAELMGRSVIFVFGQVARPGIYPVEEKSTLLQAIGLAGGPAPGADLKNVRVVMKQGVQSTVAKVNLDKYLHQGNPPDLLLHPGDTVVVPEKSGVWRKAWSVMTNVAAVTSSVIGIVYIVDRLKE
ncbi:MAG: hypothetical protein AMJ92_05755 [candidate division Zixibacteria bacterium SM23_81]|nr:MAG: hypothetical protein AMJ92_05755 [candidate division Zixibacteria bacterium SM23_81]